VDVHQRDQPHVGKVLRRHCGHHVFCPGIPPRSPPVDARLPRAVRVQAERSQARCPCSRALPLSPGNHPHSTPHPCVQLFERPSPLRVLEVVHPATQDRSELLDGPLQTLSAPLQTQVCDPCPQACKTFWRDPQTGLLVSASCSSGQRFAIRLPSDPQSPTEPLPLANHSPCRAGRGLSPPSRCALPGAPMKKPRSAGLLFT